ncbi:unnamed protein product [Pseudo-nitzschia multistriata]|uniref:Uncharacterized protein n=1 Tax=Pseudo-nitzschia multistriata TaxID=183589 RepID=A0A448YVW0_9STRA|nr:unnamed protein product [Pseudo-nitzschia multistriata]
MSHLGSLGTAKLVRLFLLLLYTTDVARSFVPAFLPRTRIAHAGPLQSTPQNANEGASEDILLRINLGINTGAEPESSLEAVRQYARSFPFAAVLPVQPLTYVPSEDGTGVKVTFLRKKTKEKGSVDGGINISVDFTSAKDENDLDPLGGKRIRLLATRNSEGQTVSKIFSEKLIVLAFVKGISGDDAQKAGKDLSNMVSIESIFHKWLA